ncbi:MAG: DUF4184 family protein [Lentisphaerae bacterium]|nr:DUF4184 family protein [Lentisphaerota bacterium]
MPFTFSHPAAVLPLMRYRCFSPSALIVGSLMPDFPYFLLLSMGNGFGHTPAGVVLFCVPVGVVSLLVFHRVLKRPLFHLLPVKAQEGLSGHLAEFRFGGAAGFLRVVLSLAAGAISHVAWDAFTHPHGAGVRVFPVLGAALLDVAGETVRVCDVAQAGSSVAGLTIMVAGCLPRRRGGGRAEMPCSGAWNRAGRAAAVLMIAGAAAAFAVPYSLARVWPVGSLSDFRRFSGFLAASGIAALIASSVAWSLFTGVPPVRRTGEMEVLE